MLVMRKYDNVREFYLSQPPLIVEDLLQKRIITTIVWYSFLFSLSLHLKKKKDIFLSMPFL